MNDKISIVIPIYNGEGVINNCLNSIMKQTHKNLEIIVINDGSTDNSLKICKEWSHRYNNIKVINKSNGGVSSARNIGLEYITGNYVGFIDVDDTIHPKMFETLIITMRKYSADIVACEVNHVYKNNKKYENFDSSILSIFLNKEDMYEGMSTNKFFYGYLCNKLFKKEICLKLKLDETLYYCEDFLFVSQYVSMSTKGIFIKNKLYNYYHGDNNATSDFSFNKKILTLPKAYMKILEIYDKEAPKCVYNIEKNLLKICLNLKGRYLMNIRDSVSSVELLDSSINKYFFKILKEKKIGYFEKINIIITYMFPKFTLKIKFKIIKRKG